MRVRAVLKSYAQALFYAEASKYPPLDPRLRHWLVKLAERCATRVIENVKQLEARSTFGSLKYHGVTESQMQADLHETGREMVAKFARDEQPQGQTSVPATNPQTPSPIPRNKRFSVSIVSPSAARKMEQYVQAKGIGLTEFANRAGTTDRTLRKFRKTGKVKRDIFEGIAKAMGTTKDALLQ